MVGFVLAARHVGRHDLAPQHGGQNYKLLKYVVKCLIVRLKFGVISTTTSLKHFFLKYKICFQKDVQKDRKSSFWPYDQMRNYSF